MGASSPGLQPEDQKEEVTICKEDIWNMLAVLRAGSAKEHSTPDPDKATTAVGQLGDGGTLVLLQCYSFHLAVWL